jgi:hypothetical protein
MALTGVTYDDAYKDIIKDYDKLGFDAQWRMKDGNYIKIKNMEHSHIRDCINMLKGKVLNDTRKAWIEIFIDVQLKRRRLKLEKIKSKLNEKNKKI